MALRPRQAPALRGPVNKLTLLFEARVEHYAPYSRAVGVNRATSYPMLVTRRSAPTEADDPQQTFDARVLCVCRGGWDVGRFGAVVAPPPPLRASRPRRRRRLRPTLSRPGAWLLPRSGPGPQRSNEDLTGVYIGVTKNESLQFVSEICSVLLVKNLNVALSLAIN